MYGGNFDTTLLVYKTHFLQFKIILCYYLHKNMALRVMNSYKIMR